MKLCRTPPHSPSPNHEYCEYTLWAVQLPLMDIIWEVIEPNVGLRIYQSEYEPWMCYVLGVKRLKERITSLTR